MAKIRSLTQLDELRKRLTGVIAEINGRVVDKRELQARIKAARNQAIREKSQPRKNLLRDHANQIETWRGHAATEQADYAEWFRQLALEGRLPASALKELAAIAAAVQMKWRIEGKGDDARSILVPEFRSPEAGWAHALLELSNAGEVPFQVSTCKHCKALMLVEHGAMGRPREFCSPRHSNAFAQGVHRRRVAAARHK